MKAWFLGGLGIFSRYRYFSCVCNPRFPFCFSLLRQEELGDDIKLDNTKEVLARASVTESPAVYVALYDPAYPLDEIVAEGRLPIATLDANSVTLINVGLRRYEYLRRQPISRYGTCITVYVYNISIVDRDANRPYNSQPAKPGPSV